MDNSTFWFFAITSVIGLTTGIYCLGARARWEELNLSSWLATAFGAYLVLPMSLIILIITLIERYK